VVEQRGCDPIRQWYNKDPAFMPGTLFVVATPIGNLEDISARALRVLREVTLIAAEDTRRTGHLLARYGITTPTTSLHEHNERKKAPILVERLERGESIALVSDAGTPTVSDPGGYLIRLAIEHGIRLEPIPGPSAGLALLSVSGLPTERFAFFGFPPTRSKDRKVWFDRLLAADSTIVFYESPHRIASTLEELRQVAGDIPVVVGRELTKAHEQLVRGPISSVVGVLADAPGEYSVALNIGHTTEQHRVEVAPTPAQLLVEFGVITKNSLLTRRQAVAALAKRHGLAGGDVYKALEAAKKSGE
jgi:16S rRNA (cytidine1402-2'-O)-methyltransferase